MLRDLQLIDDTLLFTGALSVAETDPGRVAAASRRFRETGDQQTSYASEFVPQVRSPIHFAYAMTSRQGAVAMQAGDERQEEVRERHGPVCTSKR